MPEYITHLLDTWGQNNIVVAIISSLITALIIRFSRQIRNFIVSLLKWLWAIINKRDKDYAFEKAYLTWIINQHRYLGLLPARVIAARWGEQGRNVDLEKVYVSLHVSSQAGGAKESRNNTTDPSSWCKQSQLSATLKNTSWVSIFLTLLETLLLLILVTITFSFDTFFIIFNTTFLETFPIVIFLIMVCIFFLLLIKNPWFVIIPTFIVIVLGTLALLIIALIYTHHNYILSGSLTAIFLIILYMLLVVLKWRISHQEEQPYQPGDLALAIDMYKQLVIRGDPGSGKTTLLRYLAVICARALRNNKKHGDVADVVKKRLLWTTRPFPILVTLRRYSNVAAWSEEKHLIDVFSEEIPIELRKRCPEGFFERKLAKGNCLILLDAFDELGSPEARAKMAHHIGDFQNSYDHWRNRVVVTTRIVGYEGQLDRYDFQIRTVQPLNASEIRALIKQRYEAIALSETAGWLPHDATPIKQEMRRRSERLITKVESTPRLAQLATNPLLLSLIVLVHRVKLELPEERVQLYRECVEILAEQWLRFKQQESGIQSAQQEELNFSQKLVLLQALALKMQQQRNEEDQQTLLPQAQAQQIIAQKLPDILGSHLPIAVHEREEICEHKAAIWVKGIQADSGILVEQGLDDAGHPLIGFSHLTFQEYLAASAINDTPTSQHLLTNNLLHPAWREVLLLYVALTSDATSIITQLLSAPQQPAGLVLAGFCLAEKVRHVKNELQQQTLTMLTNSFEHADESMVPIFGPVLAAIGGNKVTAFMRGQLHTTMPEKRLEAIKALAQTKPADPQFKDVQDDLVKLLETPNDIAISTATRETLSLIGDPRFTRQEPVVVHLPLQTVSILASPKGWHALHTSPAWKTAKELQQRVALCTRVFDFWYFTQFHRLRQHHPDRHTFAIGKYPVTNIEYARFVEATRHPAPMYWREGTYATEQATHPVVGITIHDARAYCQWLSKQTGDTYRLPTEWEWEWAATSPQGWPYPWGEHFDQQKCNTEETVPKEITSVGSYPNGTNQYGLTDMIGNVWEITEGATLSSTFSVGLAILAVTAGLVGIIVSTGLLALATSKSLAGIAGIAGLVGLAGLLGLGSLAGLAFLVGVDVGSDFFTGILRGGAFDTPSDQATCFFREGYKKAAYNVGFRCAKEIKENKSMNDEVMQDQSPTTTPTKPETDRPAHASTSAEAH